VGVIIKVLNGNDTKYEDTIAYCVGKGCYLYKLSHQETGGETDFLDLKKGFGNNIYREGDAETVELGESSH